MEYSNIIFESYIDDFDENDIEDVYYSDDDSVLTPECIENLKAYNNLDKDKWFGNTIAFQFAFHYGINLDLDLVELYNSLYDIFDDISYLFVVGDDFKLPFMINPVIYHINQLKDSNEPIDILKCNDTKMTYSEDALFDIFRCEIIFNKIKDTSFKNIHKVVTKIYKAIELLMGIYNIRLTNNKCIEIYNCKNNKHRIYIPYNHCLSEYDYARLYDMVVHHQIADKFSFDDDIHPDKISLERFNYNEDKLSNSFLNCAIKRYMCREKRLNIKIIHQSFINKQNAVAILEIKLKDNEEKLNLSYLISVFSQLYDHIHPIITKYKNIDFIIKVDYRKIRKDYNKLHSYSLYPWPDPVVFTYNKCNYRNHYLYSDYDVFTYKCFLIDLNGNITDEQRDKLPKETIKIINKFI